MRIPNNMFIWATMNSADQGVFPMDTAFKRRWNFKYFDIDNGENAIQNKNVEIYTIDRLCSILHCEIEDIVEHIPEPDEMNEKTDTKNYTSSSKDDKNSL